MDEASPVPMRIGWRNQIKYTGILLGWMVT